MGKTEHRKGPGLQPSEACLDWGFIPHLATYVILQKSLITKRINGTVQSLIRFKENDKVLIVYLHVGYGISMLVDLLTSNAIDSSMKATPGFARRVATVCFYILNTSMLIL